MERTTSATYEAAATAANIVLDGGIATGSAAVSVTGGGAMTSATLTSSNGTNMIGGLTLSAPITSLTVDAQSNVTTGAIAAAGLTTVTVNGAGTANIGTAPAAVTTINAAGNSGGVTAGLNAQTGIKFTGGTGNDVVTTGAILIASASVDAGAGTADRLVVANTGHIEVLGDPASKALGNLYKGFEQVQVQNGVSVNLDLLSTNNTIDAVRINDGAGATGVTNVSATGAQNVTVLATNAAGDSQITIGVKGATTVGQIDTVKAALTTTAGTPPAAQTINLTNVALAGVENLELTGSNGALKSVVGNTLLTTTSAIDLQSIMLNNGNVTDATIAIGAGANGNFVRNAVTADNSITVAATHAAINLNIDATGSGDTLLTRPLNLLTTNPTN